MDCVNFYCANINNSSAKLAFFLDPMFYNVANSICEGSLTPLKNLRMNVLQGSINFKSFTFLEIALIEVMKKIFTAGIPSYLDNFYLDIFIAKYKSLEEKAPKVLTLEDLLFGFNLWLCACGISIIGFCLEILTNCISQVLRKSVGMIIFYNYINKNVGRM